MHQPYSSALFRILLLEDDFTLSTIIEEYLSDLGYAITCVYDGEQALNLGYETSFDLFLFDVKVPHLNGFEVLRELRRRNKTAPAIFLTSLGSMDDLSSAYDAGCDDYLKKPFELKELELRIHALLKRSFSLLSGSLITITEEIRFDPHQDRLFQGDREVPLPRKEARLLKTLLAHAGSVVRSDTLIESAWDYNEEASEESLRTHIKNLRKHLGKERILNIRAQGYQIVLA